MKKRAMKNRKNLANAYRRSRIVSWVRPPAFDLLSRETINQLKGLGFPHIKQILTAHVKRLARDGVGSPQVTEQNLLLECLRVLNSKARKGDRYRIDFERGTLLRTQNLDQKARQRSGRGATSAFKNSEAVPPKGALMHSTESSLDKEASAKSVHDSFLKIVRDFERRRTNSKGVAYDIDRLYSVYYIGPDKIERGPKELKNYVVFCFAAARMAVLECPLIGNALYILEGNWRALLSLSKSALRRRRNDVRIIHDREWVTELKSLIQTRRLQAELRGYQHQCD